MLTTWFTLHVNLKNIKYLLICDENQAEVKKTTGSITAESAKFDEVEYGFFKKFTSKNQNYTGVS